MYDGSRQHKITKVLNRTTSPKYHLCLHIFCTNTKMYHLESYNSAFGGFDDCDCSTDEEEYYTEEEDEDYIHKSDEEDEE